MDWYGVALSAFGGAFLAAIWGYGLWSLFFRREPNEDTSA